MDILDILSLSEEHFVMTIIFFFFWGTFSDFAKQ